MILVFLIIGILFLLVAGGLYLTLGPGKKDLRDPIDEHSKMHELGIAHGHEGKRLVMKADQKHSHPDSLLG